MLGEKLWQNNQKAFLFTNSTGLIQKNYSSKKEDRTMENIIKRLSHIENTAVQIIETAEQKKKEFALEMERRTKEFDEQLSADTQKRLEEMQEKRNTEKNAELEKLKADNQEAQNLLKQKFGQNHTKWAAKLLNELIGA